MKKIKVLFSTVACSIVGYLSVIIWALVVCTMMKPENASCALGYALLLALVCGIEVLFLLGYIIEKIISKYRSLPTYNFPRWFIWIGFSLLVLTIFPVFML